MFAHGDDKVCVMGIHTPLFHKLIGISVAVQTPELIPGVQNPLTKMQESSVLTNTSNGLV